MCEGHSKLEADDNQVNTPEPIFTTSRRFESWLSKKEKGEERDGIILHSQHALGELEINSQSMRVKAKISLV